MAESSFKSYDPKDVVIIFNGIPIGGFADGTFVEVSHASDDFDDFVGADGSVARAKTNDERLYVKFTLMQTSESNALLSAMSNLDRKTKLGVGPFVMSSKTEGSKWAGLKSWIKARPTYTYSKGIENWEWLICVAKGVEQIVAA